MDKDKILIVASTSSMIEHFNMDNIKTLQEIGYQVEVAANFIKSGTITFEKSRVLVDKLKSIGVVVHQVDFDRNPFKIKDTLKAFRQLKKIFKSGYTVVHAHSPIGGALSRIVGRKHRKNGLQVLYTAHGFHFFKNGPIMNWIIYYPIEKFLSRFTDLLITINTNDFKVSKKFHAVDNLYIPGVGIDTKKFRSKKNIKEFEDERFNILSVGELNSNKNHETIIRAIAELSDRDIYYRIAGVGPLEMELRDLIDKLGLEHNVELLGYVEDVVSLCNDSDLFAFPSKREGLGVAALEAMACGVPIVTSNVHGINDLMIGINHQFMSDPLDYISFSKNIKKIKGNKELRKKLSDNNIKVATNFDKRFVQNIMISVYKKYKR